LFVLVLFGLRVAERGQVAQHESDDKQADEQGNRSHRGDPPGVKTIRMSVTMENEIKLPSLTSWQGSTLQWGSEMVSVSPLKCAALCSGTAMILEGMVRHATGA